MRRQRGGGRFAFDTCVLAQMQAQTGKQNGRRCGFQNVIVGTHLQRQDMVHIAVQRGEQHDRTFPAGAQVAAEGHAVFARQHDIQQHQVRVFTDDHLFGPIAARLNNDVHIMFAQIGGDQLPDFGFVFNINNLIHTTSVFVKKANIHRGTLTFH